MAALPPFPESVRYLWRIYLRLARRQSSNGFSLNPIDFKEIAAFCQATGRRLTDWETSIIEALDDVKRAELAKSNKDEDTDG